MDVRFVIQGTLSWSKDGLWLVLLPMVPVSRGQIETGDGQMNRTRERGSLGRLFRENTKTFLNGILHHVRDDSGLSRPNVGRYEYATDILPCCSVSTQVLKPACIAA